ncbi:hypothetical protein Tco_0400913 [Tanacetum coccineum]
MSDSEHSTVTYTSISIDYKEPSDVGSFRVVVYGYDGLPMHPPSPDYVPGPEHPPSPVYVPYVPDPVYPEFMSPEDDVIPAEEQPLPAAVSPTADSPGYITESDPEEDPEEEDDEDPEEDPTDYPTDRDDEEEEESSGDDADDEEEEEEEHLAPADSVPPPVYRTIYPGCYPQLDYHTITGIYGHVSAAHLSTLLFSTSSRESTIRDPPLLHYYYSYIITTLLLPLLRMRVDVPEVTLPSRKRLCIALGPRYEIGECSSAPTARPTGGFRADYGFVGTLDAEIRRDLDREVGYEITDTWDEMVEAMQEIAPTTLEGVNMRVTDLDTTVRQDTYEIYRRLDDAQDDRSLMSGQLNLLRRDRRSHARTARLMESEAKASREAWTEIGDLRVTDHRRQAQFVEAPTLLGTLQTQMVALQSQQRPARDQTSDVPEDGR